MESSPEVAQTRLATLVNFLPARSWSMLPLRHRNAVLGGMSRLWRVQSFREATRSGCLLRSAPGTIPDRFASFALVLCPRGRNVIASITVAVRSAGVAFSVQLGKRTEQILGFKLFGPFSRDCLDIRPSIHGNFALGSSIANFVSTF
jgi:hypothetical protein